MNVEVLKLCFNSTLVLLKDATACTEATKNNTHVSIPHWFY